MISIRTSLSLAQYLGLQPGSVVQLVLEKHGFYTYPGFADYSPAAPLYLKIVKDSITQAKQEQILSLLSEIVRTNSDSRSRITPKSVHDERFHDLEMCLRLDGYAIHGTELVPLDPTILETPVIEDDLTQTLKSCGLAAALAVIKKLDDSTDAFRRSPPNFNASLNDARVALQTLATSIAETRPAKNSAVFDKAKWGAVLQYMRESGFVTEDEEKGLAGVFRFVSPGSHLPLGLSEMEMTRLGRSFIAGMCWFLVKRFIEERAQNGATFQ